jgi:hypothetical protein
MKKPATKATRQTVLAACRTMNDREPVEVFGYVIEERRSLSKIMPRPPVWHVRHALTGKAATSRSGVVEAFFKCRAKVNGRIWT